MTEDLITLPDLYSPNVDESGRYVDKSPTIACLRRGNGMRCPCGTRREEKVYSSVEKFSSHLKTKRHQEWLCELNLNRANYYVENLQLKEDVQTQKRVIARMEKDLRNRQVTIDYLSSQLTTATKEKNNVVATKEMRTYDDKKYKDETGEGVDLLTFLD